VNLDLTGLAEAVRPTAGEPLMVPLDRIGCDPDQPRKRLDQPRLPELADSIRAIGVVQPISLRLDPAIPGRYIINHGERRYRASMTAGLQTIPAFLHKAPGDYTQIAENLHRADLSPMEIALFIKRRMDAGEKKHEIAAKLGYKNGYVTEHLALLEAPPCVEEAYANGATSARTLYDLRRLHDEYPRQVDAWCASGVEVTRDSVAALLQEFRRDEIFADGPAERALPSPDAAPDHQALQRAGHDVKAVPSPATTAASSECRSDKRIPSAHCTERSPRLLIMVEHGGRKATVQDDSTVLIQYDDGGVAEVRLLDTVVLRTVASLRVFSRTTAENLMDRIRSAMAVSARVGLQAVRVVLCMLVPRPSCCKCASSPIISRSLGGWQRSASGIAAPSLRTSCMPT
jgi:ParB/RepB/Spo0J family partition protein